MTGLLLTLSLLVLIACGIYVFPVFAKPFARLYAKVPAEVAGSLQTFRRRHPRRRLTVDDIAWHYIRVGDGEEAIVFLHGMGGGYDIWWQQIEVLQRRYRIIAPTYPPVPRLDLLRRGILAILACEQVDRFNIVGSSLGGYLAQYLVSRDSKRIKKAVFANTFPPNDIIRQKSKRTAKVLPLMPEWMVMRNLRKTTANAIYPASGHNELVAAYMREQSYGMMRKAQFVARFFCVLDRFDAPDLAACDVEALIIEADNDPLVPEPLRELLKTTYPSAKVKTLHGTGHFPYLNQPETYTAILEDFLHATNRGQNVRRAHQKRVDH